MKALVEKVRQSETVGQFKRFFVVGCIGFLVDGGVLQFLIGVSNWSPFWARWPSFLIAVVVTWWLNRRYTFKVKSRETLWRSLRAYMTSNSIGLGVNLLVYFFLTLTSVLMQAIPLLALAIASVSAMFVNFTLAKFWAFREKDGSPG